MNGRLEKELKIQQKVERKLANYPEIFYNYYTFMRAAHKAYSTIEAYINAIIHFARFIFRYAFMLEKMA